MSMLANATSSISTTSLSAPLFQDFQFKIIGREPTLLTRLSNMVTHVDNFDIEDIYEDPLSSGTENVVPVGRPTLLQTLAGDDPSYVEHNVIGSNDQPSHVARDVSNLPTSLHHTSPKAPDIPRSFSKVPSHPAMSDEERVDSTSKFIPDHGTQAVNAMAGLSNNIQDFKRSDRERQTHATSNFRLFSPSPRDRGIPDHGIRPVDNLKALKKVVSLKDAFKAVSATARQSQRHAKQAFISAQRSAAAAQSCLATAESFVPRVVGVLSAIHKMGPGSWSSSEWTAVLRDLEDGLHDLQEWSSIGRKDPLDESGSDVRIIHPPPFHSPVGAMAPTSSNKYLFTSVEEEAQEAFKAWSQLERQVNETDDFAEDCSGQRDAISPESRTARQLWEDAPEISQHQERRDSGNSVLEEPASEMNTRNLDKKGDGRKQQENILPGGQRLVKAEIVSQPTVEETMPLKTAIEAPGPQADLQMQGRDQQAPRQTPEERHHSSGPRVVSVVGTPTKRDIGNVTSRRTLADYRSPGSSLRRNSIKHIRAVSNPQANGSVATSTRQDARNVQAALATSTTEDDAEPMAISPISNSCLSDVMRAGQRPMQPPPLSSETQDKVSVPPDNGSVAAERPLAVQSRAPAPLRTSTNSERAPSNGSESGSGSMSKVVLQKALSSDSKGLPGMSCTPSIKSEPDLQLNPEVKENKANEPRTLNEPLADAIDVKPVVDISLKSESETSIGSLPVKAQVYECEIGTRLVSVDSPAPSPKAADVLSSSTRPPTSGPVRVTTVSLSPPRGDDFHSARPITVSLGSPASTISHVPQLAVSTPISQPAPVLVHSPSSAIPLTLRVEAPSHPGRMRDSDDSISPDLENDDSLRGRRCSRSRFESTQRSRSRGAEACNHSVNQDRSSISHSQSYPNLESRLSKSPVRRPAISNDEHPAPLIGKKRPRDEERHPARRRRGWTLTSGSEHGVSHITPASQADSSSDRYSKKSEPLTPSVIESGYSQHSGVPQRQDNLPRAEQAHRFERRAQQPPANRYRPNNSHSSSYQSHRNHYDGKTPELLTRMTGSQQVPHNSGSPYTRIINNGPNPYNAGRGRYAGQSGAQNSARKQPSLLDRIN